jgi:hypothetical protein
MSTSQTVQKHKGKNVTFSGGVDIGLINVSAQAGWTDATEVIWDVTAKSSVCGSTAVGWVESPEMDIRKF